MKENTQMNNMKKRKLRKNMNLKNFQKEENQFHFVEIQYY